MRRLLVALLVVAVGFTLVQADNLHRYEDAERTVELLFFYVVGVAGPLARVIDGMVSEFNDLYYPDIRVTPVYSGDYDETMTKVQTGILTGNPPDVFCVEISELHTLLAFDGTIPLDPYIEMEGGDEFLAQYHDAFFGNARAHGKIWAVPFQRSTPIFYWNKDMFAEYADELEAAGLDPNRAPQTWDEMAEAAVIMTDPDKGQYGVILPGGWNDWIFESFAYQQDSWLISPDGTTSNFDAPEILEALEFWYYLTQEVRASPPLRPWAQTPIDFAAGNAAMMYYSTGGLPLIRNTADFEFGTAFQPKNVQYGVPVGGGDLHISKDIPPENQDAAWQFIKFMTSPEIAAQWSIESGYVSVNKLGRELDFYEEYLDQYPNARVAEDQLQYSNPKMMAPNYQEIRRTVVRYLDDMMQGYRGPEETQVRLHNAVQALLDEYN